MKLLGKMLSILSTVCYILILAILVVAAPMIMGYKPVVVLTGSMSPAYTVGSVIYYKATTFETIREGDVISFRINDDSHTVVTHRVFKIDEQNRFFITKGDANGSADANPIPFTSVVGKVISYHIPLAGYFIQYIQNYFVIAGVFLVLMGKFLFDYLRDQKKNLPRKSLPQ